jgi:Tfp pilus assembly protein PilF
VTSRLLIWVLAFVVLAAPAPARAQPTAARSGSLEVAARADELLAAGRARSAEQLYRRALELDDENERAWLGLSVALGALGRHEAGLAATMEAEAQLGWSAALATRRGIHLVRLRRWAQAVAALERARAVAPGSFDVAYHLGGAQLGLQQWARAITTFDRYLAARPRAQAARDWQIETRRALALLHAGKVARARADLEKIVAADERRQSARLLLFSARVAGGDCRRALAMDLAVLLPAAPSLLHDLALCRFRAGDARGALAALASYRARTGKPTELFTARIHASLGEHRAAADVLWPLVATSTDAELLALAAAELAAIPDLDRAATAATRLTEQAPTAGNLLTLAGIHRDRKDWAAAEQAYGRALERSAADPTARTGLAGILHHQATAAFRAGQRDNARTLLARAHELAPGPAIAHDLALLELDRNDPARALALLANLPDPRSRLLRGRALLLTGDTAGATRELDGLLDRDTPQRLPAMLQLAYLSATSAPDRALDLLARARQLGAAPATLAPLESSARLALAQRELARGAYRALRTTLAALPPATLAPADRTRFAVLSLFAGAEDRGLAPSLRDLDALALDPGLRHRLALHLGARFLTKPADLPRLRPHVAATRDPALLTAYHDRILAFALTRKLPAAELARAAGPAAARSPSLQHNVLLATARTPYTPAQRAALEQLSATVPEAKVNLARDAELRSDHQAALRYLNGLPPQVDILEWRRWKGLVHGAP